MRNKIQDALLTVDGLDESNVFYGEAPLEDVQKLTVWNYVVFGQTKIRKKNSNSTDLQGYWFVTLVCEDYIPDATVLEIIKKIEDCGARLSDGDMNYEYLNKPNTNAVCEVLELEFTRTKKGVRAYE